MLLNNVFLKLDMIMKQKVKFNTYSRIVTIGVLVLFVVGAFSLLDNPHDLLLLA